MGALEGGFLGMACGTMFFFASKYMKGSLIGRCKRVDKNKTERQNEAEEGAETQIGACVANTSKL